eukprot:4450810-Pyramimonas_sp.AAC.1
MGNRGEHTFVVEVRYHCPRRRALRRSRPWPSRSRKAAPPAACSWPACAGAAASRCPPTVGRPPLRRRTRCPSSSGLRRPGQ